MANSDKTIAIAGAGIAGLTLAIALAKFGFRVVVAEKQTVPSEYGAGLQISPNARRVLNMLGLDENFAANSFAPEAIDIYPHNAEKPINSVQLGAFASQRYNGIPYAVAHRADLLNCLYRAAKKFANIDMHFGVEDIDTTPAANGVSIILKDQRGTPYPVTARALIGADGVRSPTRINHVNGQAPKFTGYIAWRTLMPLTHLDAHLSTIHTSLFWGPDYHVVVYPLPHQQRANVALFTRHSRKNVSREDEIALDPNRISIKKNNILSAFLDSFYDQFTLWPLFGVNCETWYKGNIALIGDAAHAMLPFQAQGAAMGMEDAGLLAVLLAGEANNAKAFAQYQKLRKPRVDKVQQQSAKNGKIFHMRPPKAWARDFVVARQSPDAQLKRLDWIYAHDPFEGMLDKSNTA
ncbi:FAD-dependent monooxygenase [Maritalea mediterranea]|uniref:FAD-dependent monooxygenase n=1 Tax=Maritalea mediterranea TaxID=2909667 RepID=A0ABS9E782_9HYPH|nr:FAD-dependent monooxygenase [Maritalea mediterranea]MCF4098738.1 FAD-dependent monooxygenase [Maritalea mediterranea]